MVRKKMTPVSHKVAMLVIKIIGQRVSNQV